MAKQSKESRTVVTNTNHPYTICDRLFQAPIELFSLSAHTRLNMELLKTEDVVIIARDGRLLLYVKYDQFTNDMQRNLTTSTQRTSEDNEHQMTEQNHSHRGVDKVSFFNIQTFLMQPQSR
jgi:hypothetical protein